MDLELFLRLLRNLMSVPTRVIIDPEKDLRSFEENHCFNRTLQPMFTKESLSFLLQSSTEGILYELIDQLDICISFFSFERNLFLAGPYVKSEYSQAKIEKVLMENHFDSSLATSLKLYYTALPLVYTNQIQNVINGCILSFSPESNPLSYRRLSGIVRESSNERKESVRDTPDYSAIYKRYDAEKQFLSTIRNGDVENVQRTYRAMEENGMNNFLFQKNSAYLNPAVSLAIVRALARKAAEESGLSVITINEITQNYVQLISSAGSREEQFSYAKKMILDLTAAVHDFKISRGKYSDVIQKTMEYIQFHISERISLDTLAANASVSSAYLSKLFKKETDFTISDYIAAERCRKAAELLKTTTTPIQEISEYVGYQDNNYFVKVFKKIYGTTPSAYRTAK